MRSWICGGALIALAAQLVACGSVQSTTKIRAASQSVEEVAASESSEHAVYESTLADAYLEKARHEWAQSNWQHAVSYADASKLWAERAVERAATKSKVTGVDE